MDIAKHKKEFDKIIEKYNLSEDEKAEKISNYLVNHPAGKVNSEEFSKIFDMSDKEAEIFLSFIIKGIQFKEKHIDNKKE